MNSINKNILSTLVLILGWGAIAEEAETAQKAKLWKLKFPDSTASLGACVVDGYLYVHGGHAGKTHTYSAETHSQNFLRVAFKEKGAKWEKLPLETPSQGFGMVAYKDKIYRIGGSQATNAKEEDSNLRSLASCSVFDTKTKKWSKITPLPSPRSSHEVAVFEGKLYVTSGWNMGNGKPRESHWYKHGLVADLTQSPVVWKKLPSVDWAVRAHAAEALNGKLYVAGGISGSGEIRNTVNVLDLKSGTWLLGPDYPGKGRLKGFGMALCAWNNRLYASSYGSTVYRLKADGSGWEDAGIRMSSMRFFHRMVSAGPDRLLFIAGAKRSRHIDTIEEYRVQKKPKPVLVPLKTTGRRWPGFRGDGTSHARAKDLPVEWSDTKNVRWNIELPGYGQSSPVVWDGKVFTTATEGENSETVTVRCCAVETGKELWSQSFTSSKPVKRSRMVSQAAPTPVVDGEGVYIFFESGDLLALDHKGKKRWHRDIGKDYGPFIGLHGMGASLFQSASRLGLLLDHPDPSYLLCMEKKNGKTAWAVKREKRVSWATPTLSGNDLLISSNGVLEEFDFTSGKRRWFVGDLTGNTVASATVSGKWVIVGSSVKGNCIAVRRGGTGDVAQTHVVWKAKEATSSSGSPLVHEGHVYFVSKAGILSCVNLKSGKQKWDRRLSASCWASPVAAEGRIYFFDKQGGTLVLKSGGEQTIIAENELSVEGTVYGVVALDENFILRTGNRLICINSQP